MIANSGGATIAPIGLINTWHHDVIIPQGGSTRRASRPTRCGSRGAWKVEAYRAGQIGLNPKAVVCIGPSSAKQYDPADEAARVVAVSEMVRGHVQKYHNVPRDRIHVIPNAIDAGPDWPSTTRRGPLAISAANVGPWSRR